MVEGVLCILVVHLVCHVGQSVCCAHFGGTTILSVTNFILPLWVSVFIVFHQEVFKVTKQALKSVMALSVHFQLVLFVLSVIKKKTAWKVLWSSYGF